MIEAHIKTLTDKASGIEKRLCETEETLSAEVIIALVKELSESINTANYLLQMKQVRQPALIKTLGKA
jgi:hypothetical protein